ncbi:uncharacterized protein LOC117167626 isoform X2 [Belonocnema kinseyi]|uniref:uncharacterized protein LOC117167626 isoform X2 n=1 Tax=Belonocnema kinseyi TaxID=2817044 RepID=UPI00143D6D08|nr:uncharacterized protein LOC117167626 isoform X2 [Belonocnema kinseyi]
MNHYQRDLKTDPDKPEPDLLTKKNGIAIRKLLVSNLPLKTRKEDVEFVFSKYGQVDKCILRRDCRCDVIRAFVTFNSAQDALQARKAGYENLIQLYDRTLMVEPVYSWFQPDRRNKLVNLKRKRDKTPERLEEPPIKKLNEDCLIRIFKYLPIPDKLSTERVLRRCGRYIKRIKLNSDNNEYNEQSLFMLPIYCQKLRSLHAFSLPSSSALRILAFRCQNITSIELSLENRDKEADEDFSQLFALNKKLKHIDICHGVISGACLLHLPPKSIESIVLDKCLSSARYLSEAVKNFRKLYELNLSDCDITGLIPALGSCAKTLKVLFFQNCILKARHEAEDIKLLINLKELWLLLNHWVTDAFLAHVGQNCNSISSVCIIGLNLVTDVGLSSIAPLPKLEWLNITLEITGSGLVKMHNLRYLEIFTENTLTEDALCKVIQNAQSLDTIKTNDEIYTRNNCKVIEVAVEVTKARKNGLILHIIFQNTSERDKVEHLKGISPNLVFDLII